MTGSNTAIITGAAGGIGVALATRLAADGWGLHLIDVAADPLEALAASLSGVVTTAVSRLDSPAACEAALANAPAQIHALVHLAGIFVPHELGPGSRETFDQVMQHNAINAYDIAGAAVPRMADGGRIVLASSMAFNRGSPDYAGYTMAKGAIVGLTRALSRRLGRQGICVNAVAPGIIETPMPADLVARHGREPLLAAIPLKRFGQANEVAGPIAFLLSDDAAYISGQVINVDGGAING